MYSFFSRTKPKEESTSTRYPRCMWTIRMQSLSRKGSHSAWRRTIGSIIWWLQAQKLWGFGWTFSSRVQRGTRSSKNKRLQLKPNLQLWCQRPILVILVIINATEKTEETCMYFDQAYRLCNPCFQITILSNFVTHFVKSVHLLRVYVKS